MSQSGLSAVLKDLRDSGIPDASSRQSIKRAREEQVRVHTAYGPLMRAIRVQLQEPLEERDIEYIHPSAMLSHAAQSCVGFASFLNERLRAHPCDLVHSWDLVFYSDEVSPGNQLKPSNDRKLQTIYWSFRQFGSCGLANENLWFILTAVRSSIVKRLGGMSVLFKHLLGIFFRDHDFRCGITIRIAGEPHLMFAKFGILVSDEAALKSVWNNKGAAGTLPCILCSNVVAFSSRLHETDTSNLLVPSTETDISKFVLRSDDSIQQTLTMLGQQRNVLSVAAFQKLEQSVGLNYRPDGLLMDPTLSSIVRPVSSTMYDWMHCYVVGGAFNLEVGLLLGMLASISVGHLAVHSFFQEFTWPLQIGSKGVSGKNVFAKRSAVAGMLKCSASESLSMYGVLRLFLMLTVVPLVALGSNVWKACHSFFCLAEVMDLLLVSRTTTCVRPESLHRVIVRHLDAFKVIYGEAKMLPKHHFTLHLADSLRAHTLLISCFTHERKHKLLKRFANHLCNTSSYFETSVLESALHMQLDALADPLAYKTDGTFLINPRSAPPQLAHTVQALLGNADAVLTSAHARVGMQSFFRTDVAVFDLEGVDEVGPIWFHVSQEGICMSCVAPWRNLGNNKFEVVDEPIVIFTEDIRSVCVYTLTDSVATVVPCSFRD